MKQLIPVFLTLILMSTPVYADDFQDGLDAAGRGDYKTAIEKFKLSAEQGLAEAQYNLGLMYDMGQGVKQDYAEAVKWYRLSAEQGSVIAQFSLGAMYLEGQGITQDYKEAIKWLRLSAEQGHAIAQFNIGSMYAKGVGVIQDFVQAHKWFNIAAANGIERGRKTRDVIQNLMTLDQIAEAQKLAREWMEEHQRK